MPVSNLPAYHDAQETPCNSYSQQPGYVTDSYPAPVQEHSTQSAGMSVAHSYAEGGDCFIWVLSPMYVRCNSKTVHISMFPPQKGFGT